MVEHFGELTVATRVMQSPSNELSTSVTEGVKCKQTKVDKYVLHVENDVDSHTGLGVYHRHDVSIPTLSLSRV